MKKLLVIAALAAGMFSAAPVTVAEAASVPAKCLFFPLLQADCRAAIRDAAKAHDEGVYDGLTRFPSPWYWVRCDKSEDGKTLLTCN